MALPRYAISFWVTLRAVLKSRPSIACARVPPNSLILVEAVVGAFALEPIGELGDGVDSPVDGGERDADFTLLLGEENRAHTLEAFLLDAFLFLFGTAAAPQLGEPAAGFLRGGAGQPLRR